MTQCDVWGAATNPLAAHESEYLEALLVLQLHVLLVGLVERNERLAVAVRLGEVVLLNWLLISRKWTTASASTNCCFVGIVQMMRDEPRDLRLLGVRRVALGQAGDLAESRNGRRLLAQIRPNRYLHARLRGQVSEDTGWYLEIAELELTPERRGRANDALAEEAGASEKEKHCVQRNQKMKCHRQAQANKHQRCRLSARGRPGWPWRTHGAR